MKNKNITFRPKKAISLMVCIAMLLIFSTPNIVLKSSAVSSPAPATLSESFNDITTLSASGWVMQNMSNPIGITNWFQGTSVAGGGPFDAYSGAPNAYIGANFNNTSGSAGTISNWLITPEMTIKNGTLLRFYTRKPTVSGGMIDYPDRLEVRLSQNGSGTNVGTGATTIGDFTTLILSINPSLVANVYPQTWTEYKVFITDLDAPITGRFAFRYYVTSAGPSGSNSDYIGIDDVSVESAVSMSALSAPAAIQAGSAPSITAPTITTNYIASTTGWQIKRTTDASYTSYTSGTSLDASYHGASLRYSATYALGTIYSNAVTLTVNVPTTLSLTATPSGSDKIGNSVTFKATVSTESSGAGTPTGSVSFYDGETLLGSSITLQSGIAELTTSTLTLGEHNIKAVFAPTNNSISSENSITYTINKQDQSSLTISGAPSSITFGDSSFTLATQGGSGSGAVTWESDNTDVLTINATTGAVIVVNAGNAKITARKAADGTYNETSASIDLTVNTANQQSITINQSDSILDLSENELQLSITGGSGSGAVTWESDNDAVATVSNTGLITLIGKGTATITVTKTADNNHSSAVSDSIVITVVDKSDLRDLINDAVKQKDSAVIGEGKGKYTEASYDTFSKAISDAQTVLNNENATQTEIDTAITELENAIAAFLPSSEDIPSSSEGTPSSEDMPNTGDSTTALPLVFAIISILGAVLIKSRLKNTAQANS